MRHLLVYLDNDSRLADATHRQATLKGRSMSSIESDAVYVGSDATRRQPSVSSVSSDGES